MLAASASSVSFGVVIGGWGDAGFTVFAAVSDIADIGGAGGVEADAVSVAAVLLPEHELHDVAEKTTVIATAHRRMNFIMILF